MNFSQKKIRAKIFRILCAENFFVFPASQDIAYSILYSNLYGLKLPYGELGESLLLGHPWFCKMIQL